MTKFTTIFLLFFAIGFLSSCGADKLNKSSAKNQLGISTAGECSFNTSGPLVCGKDGKEYLNQDQALCLSKEVDHIGHCQCSDTLMVCGSDGLDHTECEAIRSLDYTIIKLVPCSTQEM